MPFFILLLAVGGILFAGALAKGAAAQAVAPPPEQPELLGWAPLASAQTIFPNPTAAENAHLIGKSVIFEMWKPHAKCITPIVARFYGRIAADDSSLAFLRYAISLGGLVELTSGTCSPHFPPSGVLVHAVPFQSIVEVYGAGAIAPLPEPAPVHPKPLGISCEGGVISDPKVRAEYELFASDPVGHAHLACDLVFQLRGEDGCDALADAIESSIVATHTDCSK